MLYNLRFFSSKCSLFHDANLFDSCIIHISYTECAKIKKNNSGAKWLIEQYYGWIILGWISRRWDGGMWTGLGWPRIGTGGGSL